LKSARRERHQRDERRVAVNLLITNLLSLGTAFGLGMTAEQVGAITAVGNSTMILFNHIFGVRDE